MEREKGRGDGVRGYPHGVRFKDPTPGSWLMPPEVMGQWIRALFAAFDWCKAEHGERHEGCVYAPLDLVRKHVSPACMAELERAGLVNIGIYEYTEYALFPPTGEALDNVLRRDAKRSHQ